MTTVAKRNTKSERGLKAEGFSTKSRMKNAKVDCPPKAGAFDERPLSTPTDFKYFYERGDFPIALEHDTKGNKIAWKVSNQIRNTNMVK